MKKGSRITRKQERIKRMGRDRGRDHFMCSSLVIGSKLDYGCRANKIIDIIDV